MSIKKSNVLESLPRVLVILGPTASGKTKLAVSLADSLNGEIISADSRQVYQGMDIGTGKDLGEYKIGRRKIAYHLIDVVSPSNKFDLAKYQGLAFKAIEKVLKKGKLPILVGGSGLYLQAVVDNYDLSAAKADDEERSALEKLSVTEVYEKINAINPSFAEKINNSDRHNLRRLSRYLQLAEQGPSLPSKLAARYNYLLLGFKPGKELMRAKIQARLTERLEKEDLAGEVKRLHKEGVSWQRLESFGLEYKFVAYYLQKKISYEKMALDLNIAIRQFAKRQLTWFARWEKQGRKIVWLKNAAGAETEIKQWLK